jgi:hypothetical protein
MDIYSSDLINLQITSCKLLPTDFMWPAVIFNSTLGECGNSFSKFIDIKPICCVCTVAVQSHSRLIYFHPNIGLAYLC